jgi:hypothetical protein
VGGTFWATARCCSGPLWVGIPSWMGFSRPQLVVVSGLFGWESLRGWDFLGHNLLLSQASLVGIPQWIGFSRPQLVVVSGLFFLDGILAITKPFSRTFSFSRWNSRDTQFGGRLFSYIYHKEYLHRIRLVKNLAS